MSRSDGSQDLCQERYLHSDTVSEARSGLAAERVYRDLAALFSALSDPTRAKIVHLLVRQELCTCDLAAVLGISDPAVSQHLRLLRSLHLVKARREGKFIIYSLDDAHIALLFQTGLTHQGHAAELVAVPGAVADKGVA